MPQLPSGRHIALDRQSLAQLIERMQDETFVNDLLVIERPNDLLPYIDLIYLQPGTRAADIDYAEGSVPAPEDLEPVHSGFTLKNINQAVKDWPEEDTQALIEFLRSKRTREFVADTLKIVAEEKKKLLAHPSFAVRCQAAYWLGGVHPLQTND